MIRNIGGFDRIARLVLGIALFSLLFILSGPERYIGLIGLVFIGTSAFATCPLYLPLKLSTRRDRGQTPS